MTERQSAEVIRAVSLMAQGFATLANGLVVLTEVLQEQHDENYAEDKEDGW